MKRSWPTVRLGEVLEQDTDFIENPEARVYPKLSVKLYGKGVILDAPTDGTFLKMKRHQIAKAGQVILSEIWGKKGAIGFVPPEGEGALCTSHFFLFNVRTEKLDPRWLQAVFTANYLEEQLGSEAKGTTGYAAVRPKTLLSCEIPLPPLPEQQRIVTRIEELAAKIAEARSLREKTVEEAEALMHSEINRLIENMKNAGIPECTVGSITTFDRYGPRFYNQSYSETGTPIVRATDIDDHGRIDFSTMPRLDVPGHEVVRLKVSVGDLLLVRSGSIGLSAVFQEPDLDCIPAAYLIQFRFCAKADPFFVRYCLQASSIQQDLTGRGTTVQNLNATKVKETAIPLPSLPQQRRIVAYLDGLQAKVDALKRLQAETAAELEALLPAVLDKAFKGEL